MPCGDGAILNPAGMFRFPDVVSSSSLSAVGIYHDLSSTEVSHSRFSQALGSAVILQGVPPRAAFSASIEIPRLAQFDCRCQSCPLAAVPAMRHRASVFIDIDHLADISWVYLSSLSPSRAVIAGSTDRHMTEPPRPAQLELKGQVISGRRWSQEMFH